MQGLSSFSEVVRAILQAAIQAAQCHTISAAGIQRVTSDVAKVQPWPGQAVAHKLLHGSKCVRETASRTTHCFTQTHRAMSCTPKQPAHPVSMVGWQHGHPPFVAQGLTHTGGAAADLCDALACALLSIPSVPKDLQSKSFLSQSQQRLEIAVTGAMSDTALFYSVRQQSGAAADVTAAGAGQQPC